MSSTLKIRMYIGLQYCLLEKLMLERQEILFTWKARSQIAYLRSVADILFLDRNVDELIFHGCRRKARLQIKGCF